MIFLSEGINICIKVYHLRAYIQKEKMWTKWQEAHRDVSSHEASARTGTQESRMPDQEQVENVTEYSTKRVGVKMVVKLL